MDGDFYPQDIKRMIRDGKAQCWVSMLDGELEGALVTQVQKFPTGSVCLLWIISGRNMREWIGDLDKIIEWARLVGCTKMRLHGRKGWKKVLKDFEETAVVLERTI